MEGVEAHRPPNGKSDASSGAAAALLLATPTCELKPDRLESMNVFREFPSEGLRRLTAAGRPRSFAPGSRLMHQGEAAESLYVLTRGRVRVQRFHASLTGPLVLSELGPGEVVGEMGILDGEPRSATVIALDHVQAFEIRAEALFQTVREVPGMAGALLKLLSRRIRDLDEVVEQALGRLYRQHELILSSVVEGICLLDTTGRATFANPAAASLLGQAADELSGQGLHDLVHPGCADADCALAAALRGERARRGVDEAFTRKDGSTFPAEYVGTPIDDGDHPAGVVVTFWDVTERRAVERMKDEFVSIVSHELRTPLTSIRGSLGLLASGQLGQLPERAQRMLEIADSNTDRLVRLINDLLDIERMESGKATMEKEDAQAADLMIRAADLMRPMADKAGVSLIVEPLEAPLFVDTDRILQTLSNLLSNAIKFSPPAGRVWLEGDREGDWVQFRVRDEGRGIPADKLGAVFERFQQVDSSDSREKGGTGLGLPICRTIVQGHGGRIWVESELGLGSTFLFTLPALRISELLGVEAPIALRVLVCHGDAVARDAAEAALIERGCRAVHAETLREAIERTEADDVAAIVVDLTAANAHEVVAMFRARPRTRRVPIVSMDLLTAGDEQPARRRDRKPRRGAPDRRRILLAEDDDDLAQVLAQTFEQHGVETYRASTGREAIRLAQRVRPDLLVLDIVLPEGDGYSVVDWLRLHDHLRTLPVVVYSARDLDEGDRGRLSLGQTLFFTKSQVGPEAFRDRIVDLLGRIVLSRGSALS